MRDEAKTKEQLIKELAELRKSNAELEKELETQEWTERVQEETKLLLETIFDFTHILMAYMDPRFNFIKVNRAYAEADDKEPNFFPGLNHFDLYPNEENREIFQRVVDTGEPYFTAARPFEYAEHPERGLSYWDWSLVPIKIPGGTVIGLLLTLANVTDRVLMEKEVQESEAKLRTLFNLIPVGISILDKDRNILYKNPALERILDMPKEKLLKKEYVKRKYLRNDGTGMAMEEFPSERAFKEQKLVENVEIGVEKEDGDTIWLNVSAVPLSLQEWRVAITTSDITALKQAEEEIRASLQEKEILLKEIHHRVKNNMAMISSLLNLQSETYKDPILKNILNEGKRRIKAMSIVHERLYQSRDLSRIDLPGFIKSLVDDISASHDIHIAGIPVVHQVENVFLNPDFTIYIGLIVSELVTNAYKYAFPPDKRSKTDEIRIKFSKTKERFILEVSDNGIGMTEDPDFKSMNTLGLRIVRLSAKKLNGFIEVDRSSGTCFKIYFPQAK